MTCPQSGPVARSLAMYRDPLTGPVLTLCLQETRSTLESLLWCTDSSQWWLCVYRRHVPHWSLCCGVQTPVNDDFVFTGDMFHIGVSPVVYRLQPMLTLCLQETCSRLESLLWCTVYQMLQATELCVTSMSFFAVSQSFPYILIRPQVTEGCVFMLLDKPYQ